MADMADMQAPSSPCKRRRQEHDEESSSPCKRHRVAEDDAPCADSDVESSWSQLHHEAGDLVKRAWLDFEKAGDIFEYTPGVVRVVDRHGCIPRLRARQWLQWCGGKNLSVDDLLATSTEDSEATFAQIALDVPRTCPGRGDYLTEHSPGQIALTRVLRAYALHNPSVGYLQSMNFVGALALEVMKGDEDAALAVCVAIFDRVLPTYYHEFEGLKKDTLHTKFLLHRNHPDLARVLMACPCDVVATLAPGWLLPLFFTQFPVLVVARIWDSLLLRAYANVDGLPHEFLARVAAAIFVQHREEILAARTSSGEGGLLHNLFTALRARPSKTRNDSSGSAATASELIRSATSFDNADFVASEFEVLWKRGAVANQMALERQRSDASPLVLALPEGTAMQRQREIISAEHVAPASPIAMVRRLLTPRRSSARRRRAGRRSVPRERWSEHRPAPDRNRVARLNLKNQGQIEKAVDGKAQSAPDCAVEGREQTAEGDENTDDNPVSPCVRPELELKALHQ